MSVVHDANRLACDLIARHGDDAAIQAAMKADAALERGDLDDSALWREVMETIKAQTG